MNAIPHRFAFVGAQEYQRREADNRAYAEGLAERELYALDSAVYILNRHTTFFDRFVGEAGGLNGCNRDEAKAVIAKLERITADLRRAVEAAS